MRRRDSKGSIFEQSASMPACRLDGHYAVKCKPAWNRPVSRVGALGMPPFAFLARISSHRVRGRGQGMFSLDAML